MNTYIVAVALSLFLLSVVTRTLPFWFGKWFKENKTLAHIGRELPAYVMMLLVLYEIKLDSFVVYPYALPALLSLLLVVIIHLWYRQVLLSMLLGTVSYVILLHFF